MSDPYLLPRQSLVPPTGPEYIYRASILRWVDGDTFDARVDLGFRTWIETRFRLFGVNAPEKGQEGFTEATGFCEQTAPVGGVVILRTYKAPDKYGRWLAEVWVGDVSIGIALIEGGLALDYIP